MGRNCLYDADSADNAFDTAGNWDTDTAPVNTDSVAFPKHASDSDWDIAGSDQSEILLVNFDVEPGCYANFGSRLTPLHIDTDYLTFDGSGQANLQIDNSTSIRILGAGPAGDEFANGINLTGSSNTLLIVDAASNDLVGIASLANDTGAFTTVDIRGGTVTIGEGVTMTTLQVSGATVTNYSAATTLNQTGGTVYQQANALTTINGDGGKLYYNSSSGYTTANVRKGFSLDFTKSPAALTVGTGGATTLYAGGQILVPQGGLITFDTKITLGSGAKLIAT